MNESILITGAAGNLGSAVCKKFLDTGNRVTAVVAPGDDVKFMSHKNLRVYAMDLSAEKEAEKLINQMIKDEGLHSFAVLTVGGFAMGGLSETGVADIRNMIQLNFETAYICSRVLFQHFTEKEIRGRIILIGARPGLYLRQAKGTVAYGFSKSLIFSLADIINQSGKERGIDAAVIVPSIIDTPSNRQAIPEADFSKWVSPVSLAENIYFLSTPAGREQRKVIFKIYGDS
jgi:NAD(P)-dependent dehydrogenase (short-subunit alcohol dehydrogenase family)